MSLSKRLQWLQVEEEISDEKYQKYSLEELSAMKIRFGQTYKGRTFEDIWNNHQSYVLWFVQHYEKSRKDEHRVFLWYIRAMIEKAELRGERIVVKAQPEVAVENEPTTSAPPPTRGSLSKAKAKPKSQAYQPPRPQPVEFDDDVLSEVWSDPPFDMVAENPMIEDRLLKLEDAIGRVILHLEQKQNQ